MLYRVCIAYTSLREMYIIFAVAPKILHRCFLVSLLDLLLSFALSGA